MQELLIENLTTFFSSLILDQQLTVSILKEITRSQLERMLSFYPLGVQFQLEIRFIEWRKSIGNPVVCCGGPPPSIAPLVNVVPPLTPLAPDNKVTQSPGKNLIHIMKP